MKWAGFVLSVVAALPAAAVDCDGLKSLALEHTTVTAAHLIEAGGLATGRDLPSFCRVAATLRPTSDSEIKFELWLPAVAGWNGKFEAIGNGGWSGSISPQQLAGGLRRGFAVSMSDLGHEGGSASFALGHPEKLVDFGYRAAHEVALASKALVAKYYEKPAKYAYWNGCSAGGRSAMMEAQRYPEDFDGIIAGAPGLNWTGRSLLSVWVAQALHRDEASYIPPTKYPLIHGAALKKCDAADGVEDGVIEDPMSCRFDPAELQCKGEDGTSCLTAPQVKAAQAIYGPIVNPRTKEAIAPGFARGSELGWATMGGPQIFGLGADLFRYVVFKDTKWDYKTFNFDSDAELSVRVGGPVLNAMNPDLRPFLERGGKLIQYHGWADPQISPITSVQYYGTVAEKLGGAKNLQSGYRLFMVPGMAHCGGGDGASQFDMVSAIEQWVEKGTAPDSIPASRVRDGKVDRTRPLCPYPQVAKYSGRGSVDEAGSFVCRMP